MAASQEKAASAVIEDALQVYLTRQHVSGACKPVRLVTFCVRGLLPGVDLDDSAELLDVMEPADGSRL
jgi:hypothetical protein